VIGVSRFFFGGRISMDGFSSFIDKPFTKQFLPYAYKKSAKGESKKTAIKLKVINCFTIFG